MAMSSGSGEVSLRNMDYSVIQQCMHCGMCLPVCPTYASTKKERHSPRGRIALMRAVADDDLVVSQAFAEEMDFCLGCLACQTACPAAVDYAQLFEASRAAVASTGARPGWLGRISRLVTLGFLFRRPRILRIFGRATRFGQKTGLLGFLADGPVSLLLPPRWRRLMRMVPKIEPKFSDERIAERERPAEPRYRVGFLTGCVQDLAYSSMNRDTVDVLLANHCEVITPRAQHCCGSIHGHNGEVDWAKEVARKNIASFDLDSLDAVISNAGGCGSHLRHYGRLLADEPTWWDRAKLWDSKVRDIHEWLEQIGFRVPAKAPWASLRVTYHDSCHLTHGQKITQQPRTILRSLPGVTLVELAEANWCCGSAGVYSITQPETSDELLKRKIANIVATDAEALATANPGCDLQIQRGLAEAGQSREVTSPISLLARCYHAEKVLDATRRELPT